jgi:hypothetical protein
MPPLLVFLHIPRTGGTSIKAILSEVYGPRGLYVHAPLIQSAIRAYRTLPEERARGLRAIWGHMPFGIHFHIKREVRYVTMLRDPLENMCSEYWYIKRTPDHYLTPLASLPFEHWLEEATVSAWDASNAQTRYLAGLDWTHRRHEVKQPSKGKPLAQPLTDEHEKIAKHRLLHKIDIVGVTEHLPFFVSRCAERFGWESVPRIPELEASGGVASSRRASRRSVLPEHVVRRADELLGPDLRLYLLAKDLATPPDAS